MITIRTAWLFLCIIRALLLGLYIRTPDFWKLPNGYDTGPLYYGSDCMQVPVKENTMLGNNDLGQLRHVSELTVRLLDSDSTDTRTAATRGRCGGPPSQDFRGAASSIASEMNLG